MGGRQNLENSNFEWTEKEGSLQSDISLELPHRNT